MSTRQNCVNRRRPAIRAGGAFASDTSPASAPLLATTSVSVESALDECVAAICIVEVTLHSLESQEIASPEQEVLRRALKVMWSVHDWMYELKSVTADGDSAEWEDEP